MLKHKEDESKHIESKKQLDIELQFLIAEMQAGKDKNTILPLLNKLQLQFSTYITDFEDFIVRVSENGYYRSKGEIKDVLISIENFLNSNTTVAEAINTVSSIFNLPQSYQEGNFITTAQIILRTHNKKRAKEISNLYKNKGLSTNGFDSKEKIFLNRHGFDMTRVISFTLGLICTLYFLYEYNTGHINNGIGWFNYRLFVPAGLGAIIFSLFPATMQLKVRAGVAATGIVAFIIFFYTVNPAKVPDFELHSTDTNETPTKNK
ncbi:hypothetical protein [Pectobacterium aroidearum]|uniref:hypothetical protein n=1 Tax=Pectobacterium aroidearum TaxID=1201031 RepID=UPI003315E9E2